METKNVLRGLILAMLFVSIMPVSAAEESPATKDYLNARYALLSCRISFVTGVMEATYTRVPQASDLHSNVAELKQNQKKL